MSDSAKRNKISPLSLFYILFICRIVVCLTSVHSISTTEINSQALISFVIAMVMTVVFSLPAVFCYKMNKNPIDIKWVSKLYYVYFILVVAVSVSRFSYFASTTLNPETERHFETVGELLNYRLDSNDCIRDIITQAEVVWRNI